MTKLERIKEKEAELTEIYKDLPKDQFIAASDLIKRAAFMIVQLEDLEQDINEHGVIEEYLNGKHQRGRKQSVAIKSYNSLMPKYSATISKLLKLLPQQKTETPKLMSLKTAIEEENENSIA